MLHPRRMELANILSVRLKNTGKVTGKVTGKGTLGSLNRKHFPGEHTPGPPRNLRACLGNRSVFILDPLLGRSRDSFPFHSTKNKKQENGEDIEQGSSLAVVRNQSKKNWSYEKVYFFLVNREMPNLLSVKCETAILFSMKRDQYRP